ncbi:MATE family efflux transporter [Natranaerobius trueperi]|uniref:Probable multidrug resistance protein NorM n=1 Tax=Natranaerobius trueperi TaxID=759412 RepID=A0A226C142_9FIRM|nr:MATE family efflux transporter [Natranaerobius trueperi]OWZ84891.1 hypothetical protein CDO51_00345 [Natranaerobius trueperi]
MNLFDGEPEVIRIGSNFVRILAIVEPIHAMGLILANALQGAGDTMAPFYISTWVILRIPFAYFFAFIIGLQSSGIWIGMALTQLLQGVLTARKWKEKEIVSEEKYTVES